MRYFVISVWIVLFSISTSACRPTVNSALTTAVINNDVNLVKRLLANGADAKGSLILESFSLLLKSSKKKAPQGSDLYARCLLVLCFAILIGQIQSKLLNGLVTNGLVCKLQVCKLVLIEFALWK